MPYKIIVSAIIVRIKIQATIFMFKKFRGTSILKKPGHWDSSKTPVAISIF